MHFMALSNILHDKIHSIKKIKIMQLQLSIYLECHTKRKASLTAARFHHPYEGSSQIQPLAGRRIDFDIAYDAGQTGMGRLAGVGEKTLIERRALPADGEAAKCGQRGVGHEAQQTPF
ncbi:hypothetical protein GO613_18800 [Azoarcus communis]|uniref:hypothetical protein n=1 Tax=Parazoarcus communis TaxID=41977 RepID=UPI001459EDD1|nr:hypothetical protein [Parazoarcus communis]NMG50145.1 hypothetical protein [Parazoarcus communis]